MKYVLLAASLGVLTACGSYPAPTEKMITSQSSVRAAQEVNAASNPQAALHLKLATEQVDQAKQLMADGENKRAEYVLLRAEADAELAVALAREAAMRSEAQKAQDEVRKQGK